jgi:hypothetical protein
MKCVAYLLLLCGLVSSQVFGESAPKYQRPVVVRCVAFSCTSATYVRANHEVMVGGFHSLATTPFNRGNVEIKMGTFKSFAAASTRPSHRQVSQLETRTATVALSR